MDRVFTSGAAGSPPSAPASPSSGYPVSGNPGTGTPATKPGPWWYHMITEEMRKVIADAGITPDHTSVVQLKAALDVLYGARGTVQGTIKNLAASATGTNATVSVSADEVALEDASNNYVTARSVSLSINSVASGANGLDTGALATSTWYSVWVIRKSDGTTAGLLSLSATAPTLPTGYTFVARVGWVRTDNTANKYPLGFTQRGGSVRYRVAAGSNVVALPSMASGIAGSPTTPTYAAVAVGTFIPTTAAQIIVQVGGQASGNIIVAPNSSYGAAGQSSNPPIVATGISGLGVQASMVVEGGDVYYAASIASAYLFCYGWEDNL